LEVALELGCEDGAREVIPVSAGGGLLFLIKLLVIDPLIECLRSPGMVNIIRVTMILHYVRLSYMQRRSHNGSRVLRQEKFGIIFLMIFVGMNVWDGAVNLHSLP
jgi:hypothetical protein